MNKLGKICNGTVSMICEWIMNKKVHGRNLYFDFERHRLVDYDTGEILKDYSEYKNPDLAMAGDFIDGFKASMDADQRS